MTKVSKNPANELKKRIELPVMSLPLNVVFPSDLFIADIVVRVLHNFL